MLPPEIQRIVLLIALAAVGYLMILAWNDDMQQAKKQVAVSDAPLSVNGGSTTDISGAPIPETQSITGPSSDVPDASMVVGSTAAPPAAQLNTAPASKLLEVVTPTLKVWIDLVGGDIVRVQLPKFPEELDEPDSPFLLLDNTQSQTYIAQSGLIGPDGPDSKATRPLYSTPLSAVVVQPGEEKEVVLSTRVEGATIEKIFRFRADEYLFDVEYQMINDTAVSKKAAMFAQIKRDTRRPANEDTFALAPRPYLGAALTTPDERYRKVDFEDIDDDGPMDVTVTGGWIAFLQHYFLSAWVAPEQQTNRFNARKSNDGTYLFGFTGPLQEVAPGASAQWQAQFYAGPKDQKRLEEIAENLNLTVDYGFLWWLAVPLFYLLDWLYGLAGNWGVAIILLTVIVKAVLFPLSAAGYKSMANMRRVAPAMKRLQERYANDREKLSREMMALYKKEGANPLGGCLPMLLPMPIFIALYWVLFESVELRQAPFFFWIEDLSVMDPYFILPLLMGASMYWMQTLNPQVGDPLQVKMMKMMPIMFTVLFLFFPAGLVLYWLVNNVLSIAQQQYVYKQAEKAQAAKT
jgi:YidC/Oxa1 family membrane protein insertase